MSSEKLTEVFIQDILHSHLERKQRTWIVPNVYCYDWESDLLAVMKSGRTEEYEIKCSRRDFMNDSLKREKMEILTTGMRSRTQYDWEAKEERVVERIASSRPNRFTYVTVEGIVTLEDIPHFAGWIEIRHDGTSSILRHRKKAPLLHSGKVKDRTLQRLGRSMMFRYWDGRRANARLAERIDQLKKIQKERT